MNIERQSPEFCSYVSETETHSVHESYQGETLKFMIMVGGNDFWTWRSHAEKNIQSKKKDTYCNYRYTAVYLSMQ